MRRGKFFVVEIPLYNIDIFVSVGQKDQEFNKSIIKIWDLPADAIDLIATAFWNESVNGRFTFINNGPCVLRLRHSPSTPKQKGSLTHEVIHAVCRILRSRGVELCEASEEAFTYLGGYITKEIYSRI